MVVRLAIIGTNFGERVHLPAFREVGGVEITTICSKSINRAYLMAEKHKIPIYTDNWKTIMENPNVDAVAISVPPTESYEIIKAAILSKKHIFCEKPVALNLKNAEELVALLTDDIITAVDFEIPESPIVKKLKEEVAKMEKSSFWLEWSVVNFGSATNHSWKSDPNKGGGLVNNFGSHIFNLLEYLFQEPKQMQIHYWRPDIFATISTDKFLGNISIMYHDSNTQKFLLKFSIPNGHISLTNNTNSLQNFTLTLCVDGKETIIAQEQDLSGIDGRIPLTVFMAKKFIRAIEDRKQMRPNFYDGVRVQKLIDQMKV